MTTSLALNKNRLEALADGIFAIAMTLLVLEIKVPDLSRMASAAELAHALRMQAPAYFGFFITFVLAGFFWFFHHLTFRHLRTLRPRIAVVNLAMLMFISLLPFSTALLSRFMGNGTAEIVYFGNQAAAGILLAVHWSMVRSQVHKASDVSREEREQVSFLNRVYIFPVAYVCAMAVAWFAPQWSFPTLLVFILAGRLIHRVLHRRAAAA